MEGSMMVPNLNRISIKGLIALIVITTLQLCVFAMPSQAEQFQDNLRSTQQRGWSAPPSATSKVDHSLALTESQANVAQERTAAGGGEGKPEDWGSPKRVYFSPVSYASPLPSRSLSIASVLYLLTWWF